MQCPWYCWYRSSERTRRYEVCYLILMHLNHCYYILKKMPILLQITLTLSRHSIADYICSVAFIPVCKTGILSPFLHTHHFYTLSFSVSLLVLMMTSHVFMYCYWWCEARYIIRVRLWPMIVWLLHDTAWQCFVWCIPHPCMLWCTSFVCFNSANCTLSSLLSLQWHGHIVL